MQMSFFTARVCEFIINDDLRLYERGHNYSFKPFFDVYSGWKDEKHDNCEIKFIDA